MRGEGAGAGEAAVRGSFRSDFGGVDNDPFVDRHIKQANVEIRKYLIALRVVQLLLAVAAGALVSAFVFSDNGPDGTEVFRLRFYDVSELQFFAVVALLLVLYYVATLAVAFIHAVGWSRPSGPVGTESRALLARTATIWQMVRVAIEFSLIFITFAAGSAAANVCTRPCDRLLKGPGVPACVNVLDPPLLCDNNPHAPLAIFFMFFAFLMTTMSAYIEYSRLRQEHIHETQVAVRDMVEQEEERGLEGRRLSAEERQNAIAEAEQASPAGRNQTAHNLALLASTREYFATSSLPYKLFTLALRFGAIVLSVLCAVWLWDNNIVFAGTLLAPTYDFYRFTEFQFAFGASVLSAFYNTVVVLLKFVKMVRRPDKRELNSMEHWTRPVYFAMDSVFALLGWAAGFAVLGRCTRKVTLLSASALSDPVTLEYCPSDHAYTRAGYAELGVGAILTLASVLSWHRWLNQRAGEGRIKRDRMRRQRDAMALLATPNGPLDVKTHQEFKNLVKVLTMSNIHGLRDEYFDEYADHRFAVRMARVRFVEGLAGLLTLLALGVFQTINGPARSEIDPTYAFSYQYFELPDFQFVFAVGALLLAYALAWGLGALYAAKYQSGDRAPATPSAHTLAPLDAGAQLVLMVLSIAAAVTAWARCTESVQPGVSLCANNAESKGPRISVVTTAVAAMASLLALYVSFRRWLQFRAREEVALTSEAAIAIQSKLGYKLTYDTDDNYEALPGAGAHDAHANGAVEREGARREYAGASVEMAAAAH